MIAVAAFGLELHPSLLPPESFDLDLSGRVAGGCGLRHLADLILVELFLGEVLLVLPVLDVDGQSLRRQEPEPLQRLRVQAHLGEGVLPVRQPQVHDHQPEVVREGVRYEEPRAGQVLEPDLRLVYVSAVHQRQSPIFHLRVNIKGCDVFPISLMKLIVSLTVVLRFTRECSLHQMFPPLHRPTRT